MKQNKIIYILFAVFFFSSCEGFLDEQPKGFVAPNQYFNSEAEAESAIYGVYDFLHLDYTAEYLWQYIGDFGTDICLTREEEVYAYQRGDFETLHSRYIDMWRDHYSAIGAANMVIARVEASEEISSEVKKQIVAEAKFLRAYYYFNLSLVWGNVPVWLEELDLNEVETLPNKPVEEVRNQVIQDLKNAIDNLPESASQNGRVTSWIAKGYLARVYLLSNQYQEARDLAKDVIENSGYELLPSFSAVFDWKNKFNKELMFVVPKTANIKGSKLHSFSSPRPFDDNNNFEIPEGESMIRPDGQLSTDKNSRNPGSIFQGWGQYQCMKEHYDSFLPGDTRKEMWWHEIQFTDGTSFTLTGGASAGNPGKSGYYNLKWIAFDEAPNNGGRDTHLQRLAELYLILAEAENELNNGPTPEAYEAINIIRRRAFGDNEHDLSGLSKEEFKQALINENKWELGGEGLRRWYLWHWGYEYFMEAANSVKESNPLLSEKLQTHNIYWRIPDQEIVKNPNLKQNPGYKINDEENN